MIPGFLKNALINTALKRAAKAGDGGSTIPGHARDPAPGRED